MSTFKPVLFILLLFVVFTSCRERQNERFHVLYSEALTRYIKPIPKLKTEIITVKDNTIPTMYKNTEYVRIRELIIVNSHGLRREYPMWGQDLAREVVQFVHGEAGRKMSTRIKMEILTLYLFHHPLDAREYRAMVAGKMTGGNLDQQSNAIYLLPLLGIIQNGTFAPSFLLKLDRIEVPEGYEQYTKTVLLMLHYLPEEEDEFYDQLEKYVNEFSYQNNKLNWDSFDMKEFSELKKSLEK